MKVSFSKVNGQRLKVFLGAQLLEEELDIVNYIEFEITKRNKKDTLLNSAYKSWATL
jgi:hypothetical protein